MINPRTRSGLDTVKVPEEFEPVFQKAQEYVSRYFEGKKEDPSKGTIEIFGERYILVRAASMSVDFFDTVRDLYSDRNEEEAINIARNFLFDIAHAIGKQDARNFHTKMNLKDPIEKLSAGPVHFSHSGWAFVDIFPESKPTPDEDFYLIYDHPFSFEADAWKKAGKRSDCPVCVMNAGYSSGWCEESFGIPLVASEILCKAKGDEVCRFIMAHPSKIEGYIREYLNKEPELTRKVTEYEIPAFFKRKQITEILRERTAELEERTKQLALFSQSVDSSIDGVGICGLDRRILYVNDAFVSMFGYTKEELIGQRIASIYAEDQIPKLEEEVFKAMVKEGGWSGELIGRRKSGELFPVMVSASGVLDEEGNVIALMANHRDIRELKRVEDSLQEVQERFVVTLKSIGDGVIATDTEGRITLMNDMAQELTGWKIDEAAERPSHEILNIINEATRNPIEDPVANVLHSGNIVGLGNHSVLIAKDGTERAIADSGASIKGSDGTTIGVVLVFRDVTEQRKVEKEREVLIHDFAETNKSLEQQAKELDEVREATMNIAYDLDMALTEAAKSNDKLEELTHKLERSNKDLQDFAYIVSHDLKAPVRKVAMFGELLTESLAGKLDEDEQENFEFMIEGATRMQQLIDALLTYSRVQTRAKPQQQVDLNEVVLDLRDMELALPLEEAGGVIEVPEPLPTVHADSSQMHQLMQNLIGNGLKYYHEGVPPVITVRGKEDGNMVRIEVQDNGIGIDKEHYEKVFRMFQRLHTDDEYEGTGVGLAVCKKIVERHGGEIGVVSTPGEGSRFWFTMQGGERE